MTASAGLKAGCKHDRHTTQIRTADADVEGSGDRIERGRGVPCGRYDLHEVDRGVAMKEALRALRCEGED